MAKKDTHDFRYSHVQRTRCLQYLMAKVFEIHGSQHKAPATAAGLELQMHGSPVTGGNDANRYLLQPRGLSQAGLI